MLCDDDLVRREQEVGKPPVFSRPRDTDCQLCCGGAVPYEMGLSGYARCLYKPRIRLNKTIDSMLETTCLTYPALVSFG
jgi:hypothetical protein